MKDRSVWIPRLLAATLIAAAAVARVVYFASPSVPLDLAPDEAHYWDWSRQLDLCYYSKGPLVALLIRASCELFGTLSISLTGNEMLAVRLPAIACGAMMLTAVYVLTAQVWRRETWSLAAVAVALTLPIVTAGASVMTIDSPFTCLWAWALVAGFEAVVRGRRWAWPAAGLCIALGILAKPTMVLWVPSFGLFLLMTPAVRSLLWRRDFWILAGVASLGALPILYWNWQNDWVTYWHSRGHAGLDTQKWIHWTGPLVYVGTQAALLFVYWFVAWLAALWRYRPWNETRLEERYLWWMSAPIFVFFGLASLKNGGGEPNWPITCYIAGCVLSVGWFAEILSSPGVWLRRTTFAGAAFCMALGLTASLAVQFPLHWQPLLARFAAPETVHDRAPLRRIDATCRLRGWRTLAREVDAALHDNPNALVAAAHWTLPGEIAFYVPSHPTVYTFGPALFDRHSQYDLWHPNPLADAGHFAGRTFVVVGSDASQLSRAFEDVGPTREIEYRENGHLINLWTITICRGYRGFGEVKKAIAH